MTELLKSVLESVGLREIMIDRDNQPAFDRNQFLIYTPPEYLQSENRDRDEVHRMTEEVLLHKATGLRVKYLVTESYYRDELRYRAVEIFIIAFNGKRFVVENWHQNEGVFVTTEGSVPLESVSRAISF
ncbi:MAG: hypothetical protein R2820_13990 [Cyclobacteriaceae bacterium]|nr:hypothetical protein [Cyclobacteriaceae bacterium]